MFLASLMAKQSHIYGLARCLYLIMPLSFACEFAISNKNTRLLLYLTVYNPFNNNFISSHDHGLALALNFIISDPQTFKYFLDLELIIKVGIDLEEKWGNDIRLDWQLLTQFRITSYLVSISDHSKLPPIFLTKYKELHKTLTEVALNTQKISLAHQLEKIILPSLLTDQSQWQSIHISLTKLIHDYYDWPTNIFLSKEDCDELQSYSRVNRLYFDCLFIAHVSNNKKYKELFMPLPSKILQPQPKAISSSSIKFILGLQKFLYTIFYKAKTQQNSPDEPSAKNKSHK